MTSTMTGRILRMAVNLEGWKISGQARGPGIPAPSGQYRVGCVDLMHQLEGDDKGGLLLRLHYPTDATPEAGYPYSPWYPHVRYIQGYFEFEKREFRGDLSKIASPHMPSLEGAPIICGNETESAGAPPTFPVVVFSHGLGGMRTCNSGFACDLASHGYIVACVEHRDGSACASLRRVPRPGGESGELQDDWIKFYHLKESEKEFPIRNQQVKVRVDDVKRSLDILCLLNKGETIRNMMGGSYDFGQFKGRLDTDKAGLMGHSFGGGTTVLTLSEDPRFKCGLAMDCWMYPLHTEFYKDGPWTVSQPLYFINSHSFQWKLNVLRMLSLTKTPDASGRTPCRVLTLKGTNHFNQCDLPFVAPKTLMRFGLKESDLDSARAHQINMEICHAFLKRYLLKESASQGPVPNLDGTEGHSEHIIFGTNVDLSEGSPYGSKGMWSNL